MKQLLAFTLLMFSIILTCEVYPQKEARLISQEINSLVKSDADIKYRWDMKSDELKSFLYAVDVTHVVAHDNSWVGKVLDKVFYGFLSGTILRKQFKDLVLLSEEKAPCVNKMVKELAEKSGIPVPPVFLARDEDLFNAAATSFSHNRSMVILGKKLVDVMTDEEIKGVLAHELGHVRYHHVPKSLILVGASLAVSVFLWHKMSSVKKGDNELIRFQDDTGIYAINNTPEARDAIYSILKNNMSDYTVKLPQKTFWDTLGMWKDTLFFLGWTTLSGWILSLISRSSEYQADDESILTAGPQSFLAAMESIKSYTQGEMNRFEEEYEFCKKQIGSLEKDFPDVAQSMSDDLELQYMLVVEMFNRHFEEASSSHPALNDRIERGKRALEQLQ